MISIMTKDTGEDVKCSVVGEPSFEECAAAVDCICRVLRKCMPDAPEVALAAIIGRIVAESLHGEEG